MVAFEWLYTILQLELFCDKKNSLARDPGLKPGQETKIPQTVQNDTSPPQNYSMIKI